jgi:hypothetical protein
LESLEILIKSSIKLKIRGVGKEAGMGHCSRTVAHDVCFFILPSSCIGTGKKITYYWALLNGDEDTLNKRRGQNGKYKS